MAENTFYYDATPLNHAKLQAIELCFDFKTPEEISQKLNVSASEIRKWKQGVLFRTHLNQLQNDMVESGIREHLFMLKVLPSPSQAKGHVIAMEKLEKMPLLPETPQAVMESDYLASLSSFEREELSPLGITTVPEKIKQAIEKAISDAEAALHSIP